MEYGMGYLGVMSMVYLKDGHRGCEILGSIGLAVRLASPLSGP